MKKIFTLIVMAVMAVSSYAADVTIYVQAAEAPYLYAWNGGVDNGSWPGTQMTESTVIQGTAFWKQTFSPTGSFNIIFNNGSGKQTKDITGIISDRYFTYDGETGFTDITEQYATLPDADIEMVTLAGPFNSWNNTANPFTEVEHNAKYTYEWDLTGVEDPTFKVVVNGGDWLGYWNFGEAQERLLAPAGWVLEGADNGNMQFDVTAMTGVTKVLFTATWVVGKNAGENWTLKIEDAASSGIGAITTTTTANGAIYNLAGQKVGMNYKGIVIQNGRRFVQK
jgi:hypothetical protein